ncbi:MAG: glycosyltransferase family 2 protein [Bacteroidetes bacterium]|nr:glycosyltransferase family 2 protein [Bacteroidota bacterium]
MATLEALSKNELADQSELYIYCDGPIDSQNKENLKKIEEVRKIVKSKNWCKKVEVIERAKNWGLANNIIDGVTKTLDKFGKIIVLEDDLITSQKFLSFMNFYLDKGSSIEFLYGISGSTFYENNESTDCYYLPINSSWGWATWKHKWDMIDFDATRLKLRIENEKKVKSIDFGNYPYYAMLTDQVEERIDSWAIRFYAFMYLNGGHFLFPVNSLVKNIGFDTSGTHGESSSVFNLERIKTDNFNFQPPPKSIDQKMVEKVRRSFEKKMKSKQPHILQRITSYIKRKLQKK